MRPTTLFPIALSGLLLACASPTDEGLQDLAPQDYSLSEVEGAPLPGPASSLPGLVLWEGTDGSKLTVANGGLSCATDGIARETYLFRLSDKGSEVWDPIQVDIPLTCERLEAGSVRFRNPQTGEILVGALLERFDGCPVMEKDLPSMESLRAGFVPADSRADFPAEWEISSQRRGDFLSTECWIG